MSQSHDTPAVRPDLVAHYEQLRREATDASARGHQGWGMALFLRSGMTAWMRAWSECISGEAPPALPQPSRTALVPIDVRAQVTTLLAGIILDLQPEATTTL